MLYPVDRDRKADLLVHLIRTRGCRQVLVFTRTKIAPSRLAALPRPAGIEAVAIHSDRTQPERTRALEDFKRGESRGARGHGRRVARPRHRGAPVVVNYELPSTEDYLHRIGRTGRAGSERQAISLVSPEEVEQLRGVQRLLRAAIPVQVVEAYLPGTSEAPERVTRSRQGGDASRQTDHATTDRSVPRDASTRAARPRHARTEAAIRG